MDFSCDSEVPYTLLGFLLRGGSAFSSAGGDHRSFHFLRDYLTRGANAILWILLISSTFLLLHRLSRVFRLWALGVRIPGPPPALSFFGGLSVEDHLCGSGGSLNLTGYLSKLHENYGPVVRLWFGPSQLFVSVKDNELIKEILVKANDKLALTEKAYNLAFGTLSLFVSSFHKVKQRRESLAKYLTNKSVSRNLVETLIEKADSKISKGSMNCGYLSQYIAFNILGTTLFGEKFLNWDNVNQYEELLMKVTKDGFFWASFIIPPIWKRDFWRYKSLCEKLKELTPEIVEISSGNSKTGFKEAVGYNYYSKNEACGNILGIMLHGSVTSASLIGNILTRLAVYPDLQEKIYCEISEVKKDSCDINTNNVRKMRFLLSVIFESVRLAPAGPFLQRCSLNSDIRLENGVIIPAGALVVVPLHLVHTDISIWGEDPLQFNPLHFVSSETKLKEASYKDSKQNFVMNECEKVESVLSFGAGTRACVGQNFAILSIASTIASLIYNYEIKLHHGAAKESEGQIDNFVAKIAITKRNLDKI
ncbi:hypothetical protein LUZ60_014101 [Juncus effusus]|nr:hypothetical protein LUZ60_014101 [Juncus effusus]